MAFQQKDNSGVLFSNDKKEKDTHPDKQGTIMVNGVEYWISGWIKQGTKGTFMSLSVKPKEASRTQGGQQQSQQNYQQQQSQQNYQQPPQRREVAYAPQPRDDYDNGESW